VKKLLRLSVPDRALLSRAAVLLTVLAVGLRFCTLATLRRVARRLAGGWKGSPSRIEWAVAAASRRIPGARTCLARAVAAEALYRAAGLPAELRIGVNLAASFKAHAWVEAGGRVLVNAPVGEYAPLT